MLLCLVCRSRLPPQAPSVGTRRALLSAASRVTPSDVLHFWFGPDFSTRKSDPEPERVKMWFTRDEEVDSSACEFIPQIRAAGRSELGLQWESREGKMAQLVLLDQLSRNAFRGQAEAYEYDERAREVALELIEEARGTPGTLPTPAALFVITCLMHSEVMEHHMIAAEFAHAQYDATQSKMIQRQLENDLPEHTKVLTRFGRYPHRNKLYGRRTTPEEEAWLQSDECPGWAKSQAVG